MYVLVIASQKGGSGKTTLSGHLAVEAQAAGFGPVALIDTDPQGSLSQWWDARTDPTPFFVTAGLLDLGEAVEHLRTGGVEFVIIDTPPAITVSIAQAIAHADLVVIPTRPSPHDLRALGATVDIAEKNGKPLIFVINAATPRARITGEAAVALSQHGTVAPITLHHRVDFAASMVDGRTVGEVVPKSQSAKEVHDLWIYVQDRLSRLKKDDAKEFMPAQQVSLLTAEESDLMQQGEIIEERTNVVTLAPATVGREDYYAAQGIEQRSVDWHRPPQLTPKPSFSTVGLQSFGKRRSERHA